MRELSRSEFEATFIKPMVNVTTTAEEVVEIWPYADSAIAAAFPDVQAQHWDVGYVYESSDRKYQHVLIETHQENVYLAIVIDKADKVIIGHHKLNLGALYGIDD